MTTIYEPSTKQLNALISLAENNADMKEVRKSVFYKMALAAKSVHIDHTGIQAELSPKVLSLITQIVSESKTTKDLSIKYNGSTVPIPAAVDASIKSTVTQDANVQNNGLMTWIKSLWEGNKTIKTSVDEKTPTLSREPTESDAVKANTQNDSAKPAPAPVNTTLTKPITEQKDNTPVKVSDRPVTAPVDTTLTKPITEQKGNTQDSGANKPVTTTTEASRKSKTQGPEPEIIEVSTKDAQKVNAHSDSHLHVYEYTTYNPKIVFSHGAFWVGYIPKTTLVVEVHMTGEDSYNPEGW